MLLARLKPCCPFLYYRAHCRAARARGARARSALLVLTPSPLPIDARCPMLPLHGGLGLHAVHVDQGWQTVVA